MLVYEKKVDNVRHLFGTMGNIPADSDVQLTYKDANGAVITPVENDSYVDNSKDGVQGIIRKSDNKDVNVFIGDTCIIGKVTEPVVAKVAAPKAEVKPIKKAAPVEAKKEEEIIEEEIKEESKEDLK